MPSQFVITGAASGIGAATVRAALARWPGTACAGVDITSGDQSDPQRVLWLDADVSSPADVRRVADTVGRWCGGSLDGLVNCAAVQFSRPTLELSLADWHRVLAVNLDGPLLLCQALHPMLASARGAIVNVASIAADFGVPRRVSYAVSKAGLLALTRSLAVEWAPDGVRVNAVSPGYVATPLVEGGIARGDIDDQSIRRMHALGRLAEPAEVASAICFLLSDEASFVTGEVLHVDGGFSIKKLD